MQSIIGFYNHFRKFIRNYASIASPLYALLSKSIIWNDACSKALEILKSQLLKCQTLFFYNDKLELHLETDASDVGLGGYLYQKDNHGNEYPLLFLSRTLKSAEKNYSITEKELLAVIFCLEQCRPYVHGRKFKIHTDHKALEYIHKLQNPSGRLARWSLAISQFDFEIEWRKGDENIVADTLSRNPQETSLALITTDNDHEKIISDMHVLGGHCGVEATMH